MNRVLLFFVLVGFFGCDTSNNVEPIGDAYFLKFYGGSGDQEGISVKATPDGGFIIGGNSVAEFGGQSDYLLVKVDASGNQEWMQTYDFNGTLEDDFITDVIVEATGFAVAGTSKVNTLGKMVIFKVDNEGVFLDSMVLDPLSNDEYICNGISLSSIDEFIMVGPVISGLQKGKSRITVVANGFGSFRTQLYPSGIPTNRDLIFVKALEVVNSKDGQFNYLIFGNVITSAGSIVNLYQLDITLGDPFNSSDTVNFSNTKTVDVVKDSNNNFKVLSSSSDQTYLIDIIEIGSLVEIGNYKLSTGQIISLNEGVAVDITQSNQYIISSNFTESNSTITSASLVESSTNGDIKWERLFGTDFSYTSGEVISLNDGSIVYTGTAGLKDQSKVFLIKLKSNGDMK